MEKKIYYHDTDCGGVVYVDLNLRPRRIPSELKIEE